MICYSYVLFPVVRLYVSWYAIADYDHQVIKKVTPLSCDTRITASTPKPMSSLSTSAVHTKEKLYSQLAASLGRMSRAINQTADLCEMLQVDLHAMRTFAVLDAAKYANHSLEVYRFDSCLVSVLFRFMTVAGQLNPPDEEAKKDDSPDQTT